MTSPAMNLLIVGGGPAALEALIALRHLAGDRVRVTLVASRRKFVYRPLAVAEPFGGAPSRRFDLPAIAEDQGARFIEGTLESVDPRRHVAVLADGSRLSWDVLLIAVGARPRTPLRGAVTVLGPSYTSRFRSVLRDLLERRARRVAFVVPPGVAWSLPLYELALMTAARVQERGLRKVDLSLVTPESAPLALFGRRASEEVGAMLADRGVAVHCGTYASQGALGGLQLHPDEAVIHPERVVTLPVLDGPAIAGLAHDAHGFIPVDGNCRVEGEEDVHAAGDATTFPVKQGGIATQQADAAVESIAARAGAPVTPEPFRPVLRGMLLTGEVPRYMRAEIGGGRGEDWPVADHALWWPPGKIAGRYLSPYLGLRHVSFEQETPLALGEVRG